MKKKQAQNKASLGLLCPPFTGHLNPMLSLALELNRRGHKSTLFYYPIGKSLIALNEMGIRTTPVCGESEGQVLVREIKILSKLVGWKANKQTLKIYEKLAQINLKYLLEKINSASFDILLIDQSLFEGETIAYESRLPFINICNALMLNPDLNLPPTLTRRQPSNSVLRKCIDLFEYAIIGLSLGQTQKLVNCYREKRKLPGYPSRYEKSYFDQIWSTVATISQQPKSFEFPRLNLTDSFHFTAPFIDPQLREEVDFPWERLNRKALIYASIGTLQHAVDNIYEKIAQACIGIDCQLVISLGKRCPSKQKITIENLPDDAIVVEYAPQLQLLKKASLCITHAGLNTTLESLANGVPMVAIPIANDQPGVSARIDWTGTGKVLKYNCKVSQLNKAIKEVLKDDFYHQNALKIQQEIQSLNGVECAVDLIEEALIMTRLNDNDLLLH